MLFLGTALNVTSSLCLLIGWQEVYGAWGLIAFTILATLIYLPYWKISDPGQCNEMRYAFLSNICNLGGLILNLQNVLISQ